MNEVNGDYISALLNLIHFMIFFYFEKLNYILINNIFISSRRFKFNYKKLQLQNIPKIYLRRKQ